MMNTKNLYEANNSADEITRVEFKQTKTNVEKRTK